MSTIDDIRAAMAAAPGPVKPAEIAETLELDPKAVRNAMYQAAAQGAGIEKDDDGSYSLIPGWKPRARGAVEEAPAAAEPLVRQPVQDAFADVETRTGHSFEGAPAATKKRGRKPAEKPTRQAKAPRAARAPKAARKPKPVKKVAPPKPRKARTLRVHVPDEEQPLAQFHTILLPRQTVRLLVAGVLAFGGELGTELREAVLVATKEAA